MPATRSKKPSLFRVIVRITKCKKDRAGSRTISGVSFFVQPKRKPSFEDMELRERRIWRKVSVVVVVGVVRSVGVSVGFQFVRLFWHVSVIGFVSMCGVLCSAMGVTVCIGARCSVLCGVLCSAV